MYKLNPVENVGHEMLASFWQEAEYQNFGGFHGGGGGGVGLLIFYTVQYNRFVLSFEGTCCLHLQGNNLIGSSRC